MDNKLTGTILGVIGAFLWFQPFAYVDFMGQEAYQAGNHIGGIAYLLLLGCLAYSVLSWIGQHTPRIIAAGVVLAISTLFFLQSGTSTGWGLYGLLLVGGTGAFLAWKDNKASSLISPQQ